jgi:hypothetical protein
MSSAVRLWAKIYIKLVQYFVKTVHILISDKKMLFPSISGFSVSMLAIISQQVTEEDKNMKQLETPKEKNQG